MLQRIIHCCWLSGGEKDAVSRKCRESWAKFAPDFTVREWTAADLEGIDLPVFVREAIARRKWAFAADWVRFYALQQEGGVYFDYDFELVASIDDIVAEGPFVAGQWMPNGSIGMEPAILGLEKGSPLAAEMLRHYATAAFDGNTTVGIILEEKAKGALRVLPPEVFSPITITGECKMTAKTRGIHHYSMSWAKPSRKAARWLSWHGFNGVVRAFLGVRKLVARTALLGLVAGSASAANLILDPGVDEKELSPEFQLQENKGEGQGKVTRFEEDFVWNGCAKLEVVDFGLADRPPAGKKEGQSKRLGIALTIGGKDGKGFPVEPGAKLVFSYLIRGTAYDAVGNLIYWDTRGGRHELKTSVNRFRVSKDWMPVAGEVELPEDAAKAVLRIQLWYDEMYGKMPFRKGDFILVDKIKAECKLSAKERAAKLAGKRMVAAQVKPGTDTAIPYFPDELYNPQPVFRACAAGNERVFLPVAIGNLTDSFDEYRVVLTSGWYLPSAANERPFLRPGLKTKEGEILDSSKITLRRGVKGRDSENEKRGTRYDILDRMGALSSIPVPPKEAGLLWIEFDTHGVKPGLYRGELWISALAGGHFKDFKFVGKDSFKIEDDSLRIPVEFEVRNFALPEPSEFGLFSYACGYSPRAVAWMESMNSVKYMLSPWQFEADFDREGHLIKRRLRPYALPLLDFVKNVQKRANSPRLSVTYAIYWQFREKWCPKFLERGSEAYWRAFREWVVYIDETVTSAGFSRDDYDVELLDEPSPDRGMPVDETERAAAEAKKAVPGIHLFVTSGAPTYMERLKPYVDGWVVWGGRDSDLALGRAFAKAGGRTSAYNCETSMHADPYRYYRRLSWLAFAARGNYVSLFESFNAMPSHSIFKCADWGESVYDTGTEIVPSIRGENLYLGIEDMRYMKRLQSLAKTAEAGAAKEVKAFMTTVMKDVAFERTYDQAAAEGFRQKAGELIMKLERSQTCK